MDDCPICQNNRFKMVSDPKHPGREIAVRCDCWHAIRKASLFKRANIPPRYAETTFDDFKTDGNQSLVAAKSASEFFVANYPIEKRGIIFHGGLGLGKTMLASTILRSLIIEKGVPCLFYTYADLLTQIRSTFDSHGDYKTVRDSEGQEWQSESDILAEVIGIPLLVLDEVGKVPVSEWTRDKIREIINGRYNQGRTTIYTTNYDLQSSPLYAGGEGSPAIKRRAEWNTERPVGPGVVGLEEKVGADVISRIYETCKIIAVSGPDHRRMR